MTTTDLIKLLMTFEFGASGRSREISIYMEGEMIMSEEGTLVLSSTGDGCAGAEMTLEIN